MFEKILDEFSTPFYLYHEETIIAKSKLLKNLNLNFSHKFHFAVKANPNLEILNLLHRQDFGAEVVSAGELFKSLKAGIEPSQIIFDGPGKTEFDLKYAITQQIKSINVENLEELNFINEYSLSKGLKTSIGLRLNPNIDADTLEKITTGKSGGKFGISDDQKLIQSYEYLILLADQLNEKNHSIINLDFGGGFGVIDNSDETLDFDQWKKELEKLLKNKKYHIIFEPGRFIVADSGELLTKVLYIKKSGDRTIIITDASFSEYIRPALYDIKPPIQTLNNSNELKSYDVAGGICESTDYLAKNINLPEVKVGDYLKFINVGAYGSSMSSTYNSRPKPLEVLMGRNEYRVIRSRDTLEDLCKNEIM